MEGSDGWLYGTTFSGGISNAGTIFRVGKDGAGFSQIYAFTNSDRPQGGLVEANDGTLCGTTSYGGSHHYGTVFKCNKDGSDFSILHVFPGGAGDGTVPNCTLIKGHDGILYGTTYSGGVSNLGTVFALNTVGAVMRFCIIYRQQRWCGWQFSFFRGLSRLGRRALRNNAHGRQQE